MDNRVFVSENFRLDFKKEPTEKVYNAFSNLKVESQEEVVTVVRHIEKIKKLDDALI